MNDEVTDKTEGAADEGAQICPTECCKCLPDFVRKIVQQTLAEDRARQSAEEAELWARCFGPAAPAKRAAQAERIVRIAATKAFLAKMNRPSSA